jgi:hypothetical protein
MKKRIKEILGFFLLALGVSAAIGGLTMGSRGMTVGWPTAAGGVVTAVAAYRVMNRAPVAPRADAPGVPESDKKRDEEVAGS